MEYGSEVPRTKCLELYTTMIELQAPQPSRAPRHPRGTSSRVPKHPRVISFSTSPPRITVENSNPMHQMQRQGHTECPSPSLSNPTKATNAMEESERKNERRTRRTPRSRSNGFPSLRGESDWWRCGSRSPLSFPSRTSKNQWRD
jgi:hypothetical protein